MLKQIKKPHGLVSSTLSGYQQLTPVTGSLTLLPDYPCQAALLGGASECPRDSLPLSYNLPLGLDSGKLSSLS